MQFVAPTLAFALDYFVRYRRSNPPLPGLNTSAASLFFFECAPDAVNLTEEDIQHLVDVYMKSKNWSSSVSTHLLASLQDKSLRLEEKIARLQSYFTDPNNVGRTFHSVLVMYFHGKVLRRHMPTNESKPSADSSESKTSSTSTPLSDSVEHVNPGCEWIVQVDSSHKEKESEHPKRSLTPLVVSNLSPKLELSPLPPLTPTASIEWAPT